VEVPLDREMVVRDLREMLGRLQRPAADPCNREKAEVITDILRRLGADEEG